MGENLKIQRILFPTSLPIKVKQFAEKKQNRQDRRFDRHLEEENDEMNNCILESIDHQDIEKNKQLTNTSDIVFDGNQRVDNEKIRQVDIIV